MFKYWDITLKFLLSYAFLPRKASHKQYMLDVYYLQQVVERDDVEISDCYLSKVETRSRRLFVVLCTGSSTASELHCMSGFSLAIASLISFCLM
jgi:hypothetical protein